MPEIRSTYLQIVMSQMTENMTKKNTTQDDAAPLLYDLVREDFAACPHRHIATGNFYHNLIPHSDYETLLLEVVKHRDNIKTTCNILRLFDFSTKEMIYAHTVQGVSQIDVNPIVPSSIHSLETNYDLKFENGIPRLKY